jgi:pimeloyl-ACP methyl ester carboxylesterase
VPVKIIWGREDRILPVGLAEPLRKLIPGSQLFILERCGHLPHAEKVDEFVELVCR